MIPLALKLKKQMHKDIAFAQDLIVKELFEVFDNAVLHGGTAIWRCYKGNRFSEDIDAYIPKDMEKLELFFENLKKSGFNIIKKKISENSIYSTLQMNRIIVRFEAIFKKEDGALKEYETAESNLITVYTLNPEKLIKEKVDAYLKRFKVRDLYDVFFLLRYVEDKNKVSKEIQRLTSNFKKPIDEKELKVLIIEGLIPEVDKMLQYIKSY